MRDCFGNELQVGDTVAQVFAVSSYVTVMKCRVIEVQEDACRLIPEKGGPLAWSSRGHTLIRL